MDTSTVHSPSPNGNGKATAKPAPVTDPRNRISGALVESQASVDASPKRPKDWRFQWEREVMMWLKPRYAVLAMMISSHGDPDGSNCRPSMRRLAKLLGRHRRHVKTEVRQLNEAGVIRCAGEYKRGVKIWELMPSIDAPGWSIEHPIFREPVDSEYATKG